MKFESIQHFDSAYELLEYDGSIAVCGELSEEEVDYLRSFDDYEPFCYYLIDDETVIVCDSITGDVIGHPATVYEFTEQSIKMAREEANA